MKKILLLLTTVFCFLNLINAQAGQLDSSFGANGIVNANTNIGFKSIAVQKDGKIVAAGNYWNGNNIGFGIIRYNINGSPDSTFSDDGIQTTNFASEDDVAKSVTVQKDGKIIVAGGFALARYNIDGSLDKTFSGDGKQTTDSFYINSAVIQSDGKIVAAARKNVKDNYGNNISYPAVLRFNTDGSPDNTFGVNGKQKGLLYGRSASFAAIQSDGKIVVAGPNVDDDNPYYPTFIFLERLNENGSIDSTFHNESEYRHVGSSSFAMALQKDDKIVVASDLFYKDAIGSFLARYNADGSTDNVFRERSSRNQSFHVSSVAVESNGKIVVAGDSLFRFNADGSIDNTFGSDGAQSPPYYAKDITIENDTLYIAGGDYYGFAARYLPGIGQAPPSVTLTAPTDNTIRLAPAARIKLSAVAAAKNGTISKVAFYNGTTLLHTETVFPYGFTWRNVPLGNYTLTAKAYDNSGLVTTSAPVHISVVPNKPPVVSITKPVNNRSFAAPGYIHLEAAASDTDGRVTNVKFYNGATLLRIEYEFPYTYHWENVPAGTYTITAVATDNWGAHTTSAPVTIRLTSANAMMVSKKPANDKMFVNDAVSLSFYPNPATNIVNIFTKGLQQNKQATISVISASGMVLTKMQINNSTAQLDVSSLASGVYTIKIVSGDRTVLKQFVKL